VSVDISGPSNTIEIRDDSCLLIGSIPGSPTTLQAVSIHHAISNAYTMPCT